MASTDAIPVPKKNAAYRHYFAIRKNDGTLITTWAGQDSEVDKDGAGFSDCTNEATEIGTTGVGYLDLTSTEMNADAVNVKITVTNTGALPLVFTFFPEEAGDIRTNVTQFGGSNGTFSSGRPEVNTSHAAGTAWNSGAISASTLAADTITAAKVAADVTTEFQSGLATAANLATVAGYLDTEIAAILADTNELQTDWANGGRLDLILDARASQTSVDTIDGNVDTILVTTNKLDDTLEDDAGTFRFTTNALEQAPAGGGGGTTDWTSDERTAIRSILGIPGSGTTPADPSAGILDTIRDAVLTVDDFLDTEVLAIKAKTDLIPSDPADASDIAASFSTVNSTLATLGGYIDTEVAAIKAKTDNLPSDPADASDIAASFTTVNNTLATMSGYIDTEIAAIKAKTDLIPSDPADQSAVEAAILAAWTTAMTESYNADGSPPTPAQALMLIMQRLTEFATVDDQIIIKKLDGSTTAATLQMDATADTATSSTRAS